MQLCAQTKLGINKKQLKIGVALVVMRHCAFCCLFTGWCCPSSGICASNIIHCLGFMVTNPATWVPAQVCLLVSTDLEGRLCCISFPWFSNVSIPGAGGLQNRWRNTAAWSSGNPGFYPTSWSSPKTKAETLVTWGCEVGEKFERSMFQTCRKHRNMMYLGPWPWLVHYQQLLVTSCDSWCTGSRLQFYFPLSSTWFSSGACSLDKGKTR